MNDLRNLQAMLTRANVIFWLSPRTIHIGEYAIDVGTTLPDTIELGFHENVFVFDITGTLIEVQAVAEET